jgi:hypothetical protein
MKNVMVRAWEIAKDGQSKFGGSVKEYFAMALKMAWAEVKAPKVATLTTTSGSRKHKSWVAKITGTHPRFRFNREFVRESEYNMMDKSFNLTDGIYEVCNAGDRRFIQVANGQIIEIDASEVTAAVA